MRIVPLALAALVALGAAAAADSRATGVTNGQLAVMVLPKPQLGALGAGLDVGIGSGVQDNAAAADDTLDPKDTGPQLARAGRLTGYGLQYEDLGFDRVTRHRGVASVSSTVGLFTTAAAVDAAIAKEVRDAKRFRGKYVESGLYLVTSTPFAAPGVGDKAVGLRVAARFGDTRIFATTVMFRVGSLLASVEVGRADSESVNAAAVGLARELAGRIALAKRGRLHERPVAVPATAKQGQPPPGGPALAPMALAVDDLPAGAGVTRQEYVADDDALGSYERKFRSVRVGHSVLGSLETDTLLFRTPREATGFFRTLNVVYLSSALRHLYEDELGAPVTVEQQTRLAAGDGTTLVVAHATLQGKQVRVMQAVVDVGRVVGYMTVTGQASSLRVEDVEPLVARFAQRIANGL